MLTSSFDLSGMNNLLSGIQAALIAAGEEADARVLVKQETRLLSWECSRRMGPRSQAKARRNISRDVKGQLYPMSTDPFEPSKRGHGDIRWFAAGPNYLVGARPADFESHGYGSEAVEELYRSRRKKSRLKNIYGTHGKQKVTVIRRAIVPAYTIAALIKKISKRLGRLRATFAFAAAKLGYDRVPKWISRHFESVSAEGKALFDDAQLNHATHPSIAFGSRAPGLEHFEEEIRDAIKTRQIKMRERLRLILNGYASDHKAHRPVRRHAKEHQEHE